ncbi:hypothetical protein BS47DRAFT_1330546 [Hydnum rufescens UP504]|uniref:Cytochrome c oxidase assembly protein COX16, mitochondrial n=1 Tax=Hydnum rufescens UP504 TaxID=1448309 RepID=A0A9P6AWH2_9AGAM|nr:hypothetical protein BS47DRAFT_1330546 [Hydnum rufescens UP504]
MPQFPSRTLQPRKGLAQTWSRGVRKNPLLFGVPFVLTIVVASFGLSSFTQMRYDLHDRKISQVSKEEELHMKHDRRKVDIREEYFRMQSGVAPNSANDDWEPVRVPRPEGTPEWGVPPSSSSR